MKKPLAIFLNGPTSVGKTSLAKLLQQRLLPEPFMHIGIDKIIGMMPETMNNWEGGKVDQGFWWKTSSDSAGNKLAFIQLGPYAEMVSESLKNIALSLLENGHNLIVDEVCALPGSFLSWRQKLLPFKTLYVGLHASLEKLEQREIKRKDRMLGSARAQSLTVHRDNIYDLSLDTGALSLEECADKIVATLLASTFCH